ncbi:hypothetical protein GALL_461530 [mine drainage metagenome]|uniref:Uncharacterized protein n=1 Tax=mine drainage metagenome TaxID=410659 RepID=A0A1J5PWM2_9ZZZZ
MADAASRVPDDRERQQFGVEMTFLVPIPYFALPDPPGLQFVVHPRIKVGIVAVRLETGSVATDYLIRAVAGNRGERLVHPQNGSFRIGDDHAFAGFEGDGSQPDFFLRRFAFGDVLHEGKVVFLVAETDVVACNRDRENAAVPAPMHALAGDRFFAAQFLPVRTPGLRLMARIDVANRHRRQLLRRVAQGAAGLLVGIKYPGIGINLEHPD